MNVQKMHRRAFLMLASSAIAATGSAHHAPTVFDWGNEKTLEGTIDKWEWTQPHTFIWIDVPDKNGTIQRYGLEGMSPSWLGRRGWSKRSFVHGDEVKVSYYPLRDGQPGGFYIRVALADGRTLSALPPVAERKQTAEGPHR